MQTKRCAYCHKLQRVGSRVCSRCGRSFERHTSRGGRSWPGSVSLFSRPAASPHRVGHYSGLHPEDQPYQSQIMITPQRFIQEKREKEALQQEPKHIVLPSIQKTPVINRRSGISQVPTHRPLPPRRSRRRVALGSTLPGSQETQGTFGQDVQREPISRPFVREVLPARAETSLVPVEGISATHRAEEFELTEIQQTQKIQGLELPLEDPSLSITNDGSPLLKDLPAYRQGILRTKPWPSRLMSTVLVSIGFCILLATSVSLLVWMGNHPSNAQAQKVIPHTPEVQTHVSTPPHLQISTNQTVFTSSAPGVVSSETITLKNSGGGQVTWQGNSDQLWLTTSPKSGTFADSENIQVTVNRGGMTPGNYTGHVNFALQGQENTPVVLNVTMTVGPLPAQLSISTTSLSYSTAQSQAPDSQVITIRNTGGQALRWDATVTPSWLTLSLYHGVIPSGIGQPINVSVASQTLAIGTYTGLISFTGDARAQVQVSLTVLAPGKLAIAPSSLTLSTQQTSQTLSLQNSSALPLDWTAKPSTNDPGNWLSVTPSSGTLAPGESVTITVYADATSLTAGTYQGTLTFSVGDQTQQVAVSFVVTGTTPTATPTSTAVTKQQGGQILRSPMPAVLG